MLVVEFFMDKFWGYNGIYLVDLEISSSKEREKKMGMNNLLDL